MREKRVSEPSTLTRTMNQLLEFQAERLPHRTILVGGVPNDQVEWTTRDVVEWRDACANALRDLGVRRGATVVWCLDNRHAALAVVLFHAIARLGAVSVPVNPGLAPREVDTLIELSAADHAVVPANWSQLTVKNAINIDDLWDRMRANVGSQPPFADDTTSSDTVQVILFTSGTSGAPKGVVHTSGSALAAGRGWGSVFELSEHDVYQTPFPVYAGAGLHFSWLGCLSRGATCVIEEFDTIASLDRVERLGTTCYAAVPSIYSYWLRSDGIEARDLSTLRLLDYGGSAMPVPQIHRLNKLLPGVELVHTYGLTEAGPGGMWLEPEHSLSKAGSIGRRAFTPETELEIRHDSGDVCRPGEVGELHFRGPTVMRGYLNDSDEAGVGLTSDGWLPTGDAANMDEDGFVFIVDRLKDIVVRGGTNIAPSEVETEIRQVPGVEDVCVVGQPHPELGEDLVAFVIADRERVTSEAVVSALDGKIARFKIPRVFHFVEEFPLTSAGKIDKRSLRGHMTDRGAR